MKILSTLAICTVFLMNMAHAKNKVTSELNDFWVDMSRAVIEGDFKRCKGLYHPDAILVNGFGDDSYPIAGALSKWKQGFDDTKAGKAKSSVSFRFSQRRNDASTAHEVGMFNYYTIDESGKRQGGIYHMNALLVKKDGKWQLMMEYQKSLATQAEWDAIKTTHIFE